MSLSQFMSQYGSEAQCEQAATVGLDDRTANRQTHSLDFSVHLFTAYVGIDWADVKH